MWRFCTLWVVAGMLQIQVNVTCGLFFYKKLILLMSDLIALFGVILISEIKALNA